MPTLRPFRDYDEKDVINVYAISGATLPVNKGTLVKIAGQGIKGDSEPVEMLGNMGDFSVSNVVAQRYGVVPKITPITAATDNVLGMTLFDVKETDENGYPLKFFPRKAAEMEVCISGQAVPVVHRGIFAYSGIITGNSLVGNVTAGTSLFPHSTAALTSAAVVTTITSGFSVPITGRPIATALGDTDANGTTIIHLHIR